MQGNLLESFRRPKLTNDIKFEEAIKGSHTKLAKRSRGRTKHIERGDGQKNMSMGGRTETRKQGETNETNETNETCFNEEPA